jgi:hypothetical protein
MILLEGVVMLHANRWIISDIDGCLAPEESITWDYKLFDQLVRLCQQISTGKGPMAPLTLCSGRPQPFMEVLIKLFAIQVPVICENGAVFYSLDKNLASYGPGVTPEKLTGLRKVREYIESEILTVFPQAVLQFGKEAQISIYAEQPSLLRQIKEKLEDFTSRNKGPDLKISYSHYYLNISLQGVDKGTALKNLLQQLGIGKDQAIGIGDTEGDLPLREQVGFFACPANAVTEIKKVADYISPYPTLEGVLDILKQPACRLYS